jgi:hypothetical protein
MKNVKWIALAAVVWIGGCGSDNAVAPTESHANAWVGDYSGTGSYHLSNGESGVDKPTTLLISAANLKQILIDAKLVYGTRKADVAVGYALVAPNSDDNMEVEFRSQNTRIVIDLTKAGDVISGVIVTTTLRPGGFWTEDQRMTIEVSG